MAILRTIHSRAPLCTILLMTNSLKYHFFTYLAKPNPSNPESKEVDGAYINAWASNKIIDDVALKVRTQIEQEGWKVEKLEESQVVSRNGYKINDELTQVEKEEIFKMLDTADEYGICLAFYTWDKE